jgi:hypothetical protein
MLPLTFLTVLAGASLGGAVALDASVLVILAAIALIVIGVVNGARILRGIVDVGGQR